MIINNNNNNNKNHLFHCLVICRRLFNIIIDILIPSSLKRVSTTRHSMRQGSTAVSILSSAQPNWAQVRHHRPQAQLNQPAHITGPLEMMSLVSGGDNVEEEEEEEEEELIRKRKGKSVMVAVSDTNSGAIEREEVKLPSCPPTPPPRQRQRQVRPLFDVAVNINEKSDAFIRTRKEAMRRNYNFDIETYMF